MMTLLTTPGIKLMGAARLDREQRVGEGGRRRKAGKEKREEKRAEGASLEERRERTGELA